MRPTGGQADDVGERTVATGGGVSHPDGPSADEQVGTMSRSQSLRRIRM